MDIEVNQWKCGVGENSNVLATLKGNTLIISGNGEMDSVRYKNNKRPWHHEMIVHAIIENGVENIGDFTFSGCIGLQTVEIADSVISIDMFAFAGCTALKKVFLPKNIKSINAFAFSGCWSLESITIPDTVKEIGRCVFAKCGDLHTIVNKSVVPQVIDKDTFDYNDYSKGGVSDYRLFNLVSFYVPKSSLIAYKRAPKWKDSFNFLPIDEQEEKILHEDIDSKIEQFQTKKADLEKAITDVELQLERLRFEKLLLRGLKGNPKHVAEFMSLFNQKDGLKYLTHDIDGSDIFDYNEVLSLVRKVCTENFEEKDIPSTLRELLNQFIFSENPKWKSFDKDYNELEMASGWSADEWKQAKNRYLHPIRQQQFFEIIRNFKRLTRIESPYLETIVNKIFADDNFELEFNDLSKADFYTHVGEFKTALETIFAEIQKRADSDEKKKVTVSYKRETSDDFFVRKIIITHHNSFPTRDDQDALIKEWLSLEKGCMAKIASHLQGYCHWSVETRIDGKPIRVNILREQETQPQESIDNENQVGFTHILTFYYQ